MIFDLHIHSKYSFDSISEPKCVLRAAKKKGLNGIAITDHNTIKGGIETIKINQDRNFLIIIGAEIATEIGDIIGLFLEEEIKSRDSIEVIEEIHRQGGIAVLPHPYKGHTLNEELIRKIDVIEAFNSRASAENNKKARMLAKQYKKSIIAGSDAHFCSDIGTSKIKLNSRDVRNEIFNTGVKLYTNYTPVYMQSASQIIKSIKLKKYNQLPSQFLVFIENMVRRK